MLDMSVPVVAKLRRMLDSLPRETLPDVLASMIRTTNKEKLQVRAEYWHLSFFGQLATPILRLRRGCGFRLRAGLS